MAKIENVSVLPEKVELFTAYGAFVGKKLICCPPNEELESLMDELLPHAEAMYRLCKDALGA